MLKTIAQEATTAAEYVRRAEAFASTEATPPTDAEVATTWIDTRLPNTTKRSNVQRTLVRRIREVRAERIRNANAMWQRLIEDSAFCEFND